MSSELQQIIEEAWEERAKLSPGEAPARIGEAVAHVAGQSPAPG